ncbi:MAG: D-alanyl-D-alanine carboxypeptidase [Clostridia bacterium]|nr:D-alanyl-D-alanine carboxypeptidase [Clostridia bacterium]
MQKSFKLISLFLVIVLLPINTFANTVDLKLNAKSVLLMEASSGSVLYENNAHESLPPASVTKIMTMLLLCEAIDRGEITLETIVTASERAKSMGGSTIFLDAGEQITVDNLLKGIAVASGNDACVAVAEHLCGSVETFVDKMNQRAQELSMKNTHFVNCNGLDDDNHYTSAYDIALMSRELLKHKMIFKYTTIWMDELRDGKFQLANTNKLIRFYSGANGLKTGSTNKAGSCISATAKRDGMQLIAVVLGAPTSKDRFSAASSLLNYGFNNFAVTEYGEKDEDVREIKVIQGKEKTVLAKVAENSSVLIHKGKEKDVKTHINLPKELIAPIKKGDVIGEIIVSLDGKNISKTDLIAGNTVKKKNIFDNFTTLFLDYITI